MNNDFTYYFMRHSQSYPYFVVADLVKQGDHTQLIKLRLDKPTKRALAIADSFPGQRDIISARVARVIQEFAPEGVELIPAELTDKEGATLSDYYVITGGETIDDTMDEDKSDYILEQPCIYRINRLALNHESLSQIPLQQRLVFRCDLLPHYLLFHSSIVDAINALKPSGIQFEDIEAYTAGGAYDL